MRVFLTQIAFVVNAESGYCSKAAKTPTTDEMMMIIGSLVMLLRKTAVGWRPSGPGVFPCDSAASEFLLINN